MLRNFSDIKNVVSKGYKHMFDVCQVSSYFWFSVHCIVVKGKSEIKRAIGNFCEIIFHSCFIWNFIDLNFCLTETVNLASSKQLLKLFLDTLSYVLFSPFILSYNMFWFDIFKQFCFESNRYNAKACPTQLQKRQIENNFEGLGWYTINDL